jgi:hypothetical protein
LFRIRITKVTNMSWLSSFSPLDVRKRPPTPEFPVSPSDFDEQEIEAKKNTMTIPRSPSKNHSRNQNISVYQQFFFHFENN